MGKLIQLPNGDCIDPDVVTEIKALRFMYSRSPEDVFPDRVVIVRKGDFYHEILCKSWDEAQAVRDEIFRQCNKSRSS